VTSASEREPAEQPGASGRRGLVRRAIGLVLVVALLGWVGWGIARELQRHTWSVSEMELWPLLVVVPLLFVAYLSRAAVWSATLRAMQPEAPWIPGMRVFLGSQLGRYLPGKAWQVVGAGWLGKRAGLSPAACVANTTVTMIIHLAMGGVVGLLVLWRFEAHRRAVLILVFAVTLVLLLLPVTGAVPKLLAFAGRIARRDLGSLRLPSARYMAAMALSSLWMWLLFGITLRLVAEMVMPYAPEVGTLEAISIMAASSVAGFAVLFAPSGLGVREALIVTLLSPSLGPAGAGLAAIACRVVMTVVELLLALWGVNPWRAEVKEAAAESDAAPG
jgi:hypothetical protein